MATSTSNKSREKKENKQASTTPPRFINIPEGNIGRLIKKKGNDNLNLYVFDFTAGTIIVFILDDRMSLLHLDSTITKEQILGEMAWVSQGREDLCVKKIIQRNLGEFFPNSFIALGPDLMKQFLQDVPSDGIYGLSIGWHEEDKFIMMFQEREPVEHHPLEQDLVRYHRKNEELRAAKKASAVIPLNPLIFTGEGWQSDYELPTEKLSAEAKAFLQYAKAKKAVKPESKAGAAAPLPAVSASSVLSSISSWEELKKILDRKSKCKKKKDKDKIKARLAKVAPQLAFDQNAILAAVFSLEEALQQVKKLEAAHKDALNLPALREQLEKALQAATPILDPKDLPQTPSVAEGKISHPSQFVDSKDNFFARKEAKIVAAANSKATQTKYGFKNASVLDEPFRFDAFSIRERDPSQQKSITVMSFKEDQREAKSPFDKACAMMMKDDEAAIKLFQQTLSNVAENEFQFVFSLYNIGLCYRIMGDAKNAQEHLDRAILLLQKSDLTIKQFTSASKVGLLAHCYVEKGRVARLFNRLDQTELFYKEAIVVCEDCYQAYNALGLLKEQQGDPSAAYDFYKQALEKNNKYPTAYANMGLLLKNAGQYEEALQMFDKAIEFAPNVQLHYDNRGVVRRTLGLLKEAREDFEQALKLEPSCVSAQGNLAVCDFLSGYPRKAIMSLEKLRAMDPHGPEILLNLSSAYMTARDYKEAVFVALRLVHVNPSSISGWLNIASSYMLMGEEEKALVALQNAMQLSEGKADNPLSLMKYTLLAKILTRLKCYEEAINICEVALQYCNSEIEKANLYLQLGNLHFDNRNYPEALKYYERANIIFKNPAIVKYMQEAQEAMEDPDVFSPANRDLQNRSMPSAALEEKRKALEEKLENTTSRSVAPEKSGSGNLYYKGGLPFHRLLLGDEVAAPKEPKIHELFMDSANGCWYQRSCHKYAAGSKKIANGDQMYNFVVAKNPQGKMEIIYGNVGHFHLSKNRNVIFAGEIWFEDGQILGWTNASGHFKPDAGLAGMVSTLCPLPLNKFNSKDAFKERLLGMYQKYHDPKRMAEEAKGSLGCKGVVKSMRHYYMR